jgi:L-lactate dehydrogenase complex protein LldG
MSTRDDIFAALGANKPAGDFPLPEIPFFDEGLGDLPTLFAERIVPMGGTVAALGEGESVDDLARRLHPDAAVICSAVREARGTCRIEDFASPQAAQHINLGIVRAAFGVAETGSVFLSEAELSMNAFPHLCEHLLVLLDPAQIAANLHRAYLRPEFARARYGVLHTGPSATADIQGILVRGAQGVRSLTVVYLPA